MKTSIQDSVVRKAEREGYKLLEIEGDRLFLSRDGTESRSARATVEELDLKKAPPDFIASSTDFRYHGTIANGWKSGSMMLVRLTGRGSSYSDLTAKEIEEMEKSLDCPPTAEESAEIKAVLNAVVSEKQSPASARAINNLVIGIEQELRDHHAHRMIEDLKPDATRH